MRFGMWFPWVALAMIVTVGVMVWRQSVAVSQVESRWQEVNAKQIEQMRQANDIIETANSRIEDANSVIAELDDRIAQRDQIIAAQGDTIDFLSTPAPTYTPMPTYTLYPTVTPRPTYTRYPTATPRPTYTPYPTPRPTSTPRPTYTPRFPTPTSIWNVPTRHPTATPRPTPLPSERVSIYEGIKIYSDDGAGRGFIQSVGCKDYLITAAHVVGNSRRVYIEYPLGWNIGWKPVTFKYPDQDVAIVDVTDEFIGGCQDGYWPDEALGHILSKGKVTSYKLSYTTPGECPLVRTDVITTDAPVYPGYSGSPVINDADRLVGIAVCGDNTGSTIVTWEVIEALLP